MKIVFASSEAAPYIKTGGLGDVAQDLPKSLSKLKDAHVLLFIPYYGKMKAEGKIKTELVSEFQVELGWRHQYVGLHRVKKAGTKLKVYLIDNEFYFKREKIYGEGDDPERFAFFSKAILESLVVLGETPDVIHCNDWQTALIPTFLKAFYSEKLKGTKTVFTIHNIEYQGWAHPYFLGDGLGLPVEYDSIFKMGESLNYMKSAIINCDCLTTVSKTYAEEICEPYFAHGLDGVIRANKQKLTGVVNGIDMELNNPANDDYLVKKYDLSTVKAGKKANKAALQKEMGLEVRDDVPLLGMVSRLVSHKGLDILCDKIDELLGRGVQLAILGSGDPAYEDRLQKAAMRHQGQFSIYVGFSKELAARIYAGSDMYLMPSKSEPCGLSQLIAMRYGTIPIVHEVGGLKDTVIPFIPQKETGLGYTFWAFDGNDMLNAVDRALETYHKPAKWKKAISNCMSEDVSWDKPGREYFALYKSLTDK